jgi:hypothetical protein
LQEPLLDLRVAIPLAGAVGVAAFSIWALLRRRITPEERERRRRLDVNRTRRSIEGTITEASESIIHYQYELRGVTYFASQDVSSLQAQLPPEPTRLIGPVTVRFEPANPANSIVVCEEWSGLPAKRSTHRTDPSREDMECN